jgi:hypothetical protein
MSEITVDHAGILEQLPRSRDRSDAAAARHTAGEHTEILVFYRDSPTSAGQVVCRHVPGRILRFHLDKVPMPI